MESETVSNHTDNPSSGQPKTPPSPILPPVSDLGAALDAPLTTGMAMIAAERFRQIAVEGWQSEHDDGHDEGELAKAALCYERARCERSQETFD